MLNIIGKSEAIRKARFLINIHSRYDVPVLITGETGTGKELAARGLHYTGRREAKPFVPVNCATLTDELFASEIFGHVKGSFTDAKKDKKGLLAIAEQGTLFLDEIDSLSLKSQAALLRFLQESEYRPVGSETHYQADVRLIASANSDLEERINRGLFRADLYYRLYILSVHMPPLRDRHGDIDILVKHFIHQFDYQYNLGNKRVSPNLLRVLNKQQWPGNVRELENLMHRLYLCSTDRVIDVDMLGYAAAELTQSEKIVDIYQCTDSDQNFDIKESASTSYNHCLPKDGNYNFSKDKKLAVERFEQKYVEQVMATAKGNVTLAAKMCGKERRAFGKLVKKYNIKKSNLNLEI
ncbi:Fis family transcriptional regulator [Candidatus Endobugula sertula]|uniref:Fis family transcriptional regulator n=1 Tax=Candidatus Endobugula sertula TaxID=62101 RepID=A0A1D2QNF4_9GAMM|nr:Fis family transcriptional regulator [Candidatus Endobugula sertula]